MSGGAWYSGTDRLPGQASGEWAVSVPHETARAMVMEIATMVPTMGEAPTCHDGQHPQPSDDAFRWSAWATCPCGEVRFERLTRRGEIITYSHLDGLRATDGTDISTRAKRDEYMRIHGLAHAEDYREAMPAAQAARERFFRGEDPAIRRELRETVGRAAYQLQTQRRRTR